MLIVARRVVAFEETLAVALRDNVRAVFSDAASTGQCFAIKLIFTGLREAVEYLERAFSQHVLALDPGDLFHRAVPGGVPELTIERQDAVDVRLEKALEE